MARRSILVYAGESALAERAPCSRVSSFALERSDLLTEPEDQHSIADPNRRVRRRVEECVPVRARDCDDGHAEALSNPGIAEGLVDNPAGVH